jgi:energy-coupling factor transporter ATP-binding protein EcfA2
MLELHSVSYRYPGFARPALAGVDLTIGEGEIVGLAGPNGAGKSTLCLVASGLAPASIGGEIVGEVRVAGEPLGGRRPHELAGTVGMVFSNPEAQRTRVASTVFEEVAFGPLNLGLPVVETFARTRSALASLGIGELAERHPGRLSGGQTQLVAIASMLAMRPRHLVLDEPVAELDPEGRGLLAGALRRVANDGTGLLVAEHDLDLLSELGGRVVHIHDGRLGADGRATDGHAITAPRQPAPVSSGAPVVLRCEGVAFEYPDGTRAIDGVDLEVRAGERVAIMGQNGSGKTTLVRIWNGLLRPAAGSIQVGGRPTAGQRVAALAREVGLTFQDPNHQLFARTCRDEVAFGARNVGLRGRELDDAVATALASVGLVEQASSNAYDLGPSKRRLLALASVLAMRTPLVVLDEPTMGLDVDERARVAAIVVGLAEAGRTVVAISHDARFVADAFERVIRLDNGRVIDDGSAAPDR